MKIKKDAVLVENMTMKNLSKAMFVQNVLNRYIIKDRQLLLKIQSD